MAGRRRGQATPIYAVRLAAAPAAPTRVTADYSESAITLEWPAGSAKQFIVEETDENGTTLEGGRREQVAGTTFRTDVEFGRRRCFVVRAADVAGAVSILGDPAAPACVTPTDKFPPPVPNDLLAIPTEEGIEVTWAAVTAADLSGYIVLRAEGANGTLQPVMTSPIAETAYRDRTVQSGVTYAYAIVAVDKASPPNRSAPSERKVATAR
jgi:hypothetical protein